MKSSYSSGRLWRLEGMKEYFILLRAFFKERCKKMCNNGALFNPSCLYQYEKCFFEKCRFKPEILSGLAFTYM